MRAYWIAAVLTLALGILSGFALTRLTTPEVARAAPIFTADPPAPLLCGSGSATGCQPQPDEFQYNGSSLQPYSTLAKSIRETGGFTWRFVEIAGCNSSSISPGVHAGIEQMITRWSYDVREVSSTSAADITVYGNCGSAFAQVCGGPPVIGCLGRGYPYNNDVDISTDMAAYFDVSQRSITCHEVCGHAVNVWAEQYYLGTFGNSPDVTIMNTGPLSRHDLGDAEDARLWRTSGSPELRRIGYGNNGAWYAYACDFDAKATRVSVLVDLHDGRGIQWAGVIRPIDRTRNPKGGDANGCMGIGVPEGLRIVIGATYYLKQENPGSWRVARNEARIPGS